MNVDELREWRETVLVASHSGKTHIDPNCQYLRNQDKEPKEKDLDSLPDWAVDLCAWCENYIERHKASLQADSSVPTCRRCGEKGVRYVYCESCQREITLGR